ncbi:hypothetical protein EX30DRAFT_344174 [Ascodesmis nigricans]|uniref:Ubiquitin-conjugating enzyme E2-binding protein n=1 Tax=Ascodesmis nigricans TaxID=341454 RepID=A0A4S2MKA8_9PEZI|nr:hypothetical protein EX30DRAFT_344174 [Ascodesmis nigricans]
MANSTTAPGLRYYCELLPNIQSISVYVSLPSPSDVSTRVVVPPGSRTLFLEHRGKTLTVKLPGPGNPNANPLIVTPQLHLASLSLRIPCAEKIAQETDNLTPWSARKLTTSPVASMQCRSCNATILPKSRINTWKDLPSGNWAEAMDFWHCHKPHEKGGEKGRYANYGSGFKVVEGTGFVDGSGVLFSRMDVGEGVKKSNTSLNCKNCDSVLGRPEHDIGNASELWRIHKWNIRLQNGESGCVYPLECFLASEFIGFAESEGVRRLLVSDRNDTDNGARLKIWVFNTDVFYSHPDVDKPQRGIKVYWRLLGEGEKAPPTDRLASTSFEAVELDSIVVKRLVDRLRERAALMPTEMQTQGEWASGILRRFQEHELA